MDGNPRRLSLTRYLAWAIVLGGHVFLIVLFSSNRPRESRAESSPEEPTVLLFLDVPPLPEEPAEKPTVARTKPALAAGRSVVPDDDRGGLRGHDVLLV